MTYVLTAPEMQAADAAAMARVGEDALMQRAGAAVAGAIREFFPAGARVTSASKPARSSGRVTMASVPSACRGHSASGRSQYNSTPF